MQLNRFIKCRKGQIMSKEPRNLTQFLHWLERQFADMEVYTRFAEVDFYDKLGIAEMVEQASRLACRFGGGHLIGREQGVLTPREALVILGRLLAWAREQSSQPAGKYLDSQAAADYLGITVKSLYAQVERGRLKPLRGPKRSYRFTSQMLDSYLKCPTLQN